MKERDKFYKKFIKNKTKDNEVRYKNYRNLICTLIRVSKKNHYKESFHKKLYNVKATWKTINEVISNTSKSKNCGITCIEQENKLITDPTEISNAFNVFFTNIGKKIQNKIRPSKYNFSDYLKNSNEKSFFLKDVTPSEVLKLISKMDESKSFGPHSIPTGILKLSAEVLCIPLTKIVNISFSSGKFPDKLKMAKVIPVFKSGSKYYIHCYLI